MAAFNPAAILRIVPPVEEAGRGVHCANGTEFVIGGVRLPNVTKCVVSYKADAIVMATIDVAVDPGVIEAQPLLSLDSVRVFAEHYGYRLVKSDE